MKNNILNITLLALILISTTSITLASTISPEILEGVKPNALPGLSGIAEAALGILKWTAYIAAIVVMIYLGIKYYYTAGAGDRADVKTMIFPYLIGIAIVLSASSISSQILGENSAVGEIEPDEGIVANLGIKKQIEHAIGIMKWVAGAACIIMLITAGIKWIESTSAEDKALLKQTLVPILIGTIFVFGAIEIVDKLFGI